MTQCGWEVEIESRFAVGVRPAAKADATDERGWLRAAELIAAANAAEH